MKKALLSLALISLAVPLAARDNLGIFSDWGAFRDPSVPRCYAIAKPQPDKLARDYAPFASVGTWPRRNIRGQVHFRLSRKLAQSSEIALQIGNKKFLLSGGGGDAWAADQTMDAAIVAAMRSIGSMSVRARASNGRRFSDTYNLAGAATAMDAATVGCSKVR